MTSEIWCSSVELRETEVKQRTMFVTLFLELRQAGVPVSLKEYLALMEAMDKRVARFDVNDFYYLGRTVLVKDERNLDKYDRVFGL